LIRLIRGSAFGRLREESFAADGADLRRWFFDLTSANICVICGELSPGWREDELQESSKSEADGRLTILQVFWWDIHLDCYRFLFSAAFVDGCPRCALFDRFWAIPGEVLR
jgi:hypothetical protein